MLIAGRGSDLRYLCNWKTLCPAKRMETPTLRATADGTDTASAHSYANSAISLPSDTLTHVPPPLSRRLMATTKNSSTASPTDYLQRAVLRAGLSAPTLRAARAWLAEQMAAHEFAKLGQGGHTNTQIPLRRVFVDLPVVGNPNSSYRQGRLPFLARLLSARPLDLKKAMGGEHMSSAPASHEDARDEENSFETLLYSSKSSNMSAALLIGGPGQGKSTLGQLACQLHRAALLKPALQDLTTSQVELVKSFGSEITPSGSKTARHALDLPKRPLLPMQFSLPDLAAWLSKHHAEESSDTPLLMQFLGDLPSARSVQLSAGDLFALASGMPTLIVLDGFDEVGATLDRDRIVKAARAFLLALAERSASMQIVATTRPQGYAGELAQIGIKLAKLYLAPLERAEALHYAEKLVDAKIPGVDQRNTTLSRLREAADEPATERLLTTPLQVTILTALVQQLGRAPRERWNLFSRYFAYTYDREIERNTYASALLAEHRAHIERIHAQVALLLQVEAERDGGASARMTRPRLEEVISAVLDEDEISGELRRDLITEIATAAEQRLVFLVEPEPGKFGFEIRSLQEFMAAWALTSGRDSEIISRILQIARAPMFRNVTLFVASKLFSGGSPLRDVLADRVCGSMDDSADDELSRISKAGSQLALETIEEGAVLAQPKRARALMQRAANLLSIPANPEHVRLAHAANPDTLEVLSDTIERCISGISQDFSLLPASAWTCVIDGANRGEDWAIRIGNRHWSRSDTGDAVLRACLSGGLMIGEWLQQKFEADSVRFKPEDFVDLPIPQRQKGSSPTWTACLAGLFGEEAKDHRHRKLGCVRLLAARRHSDAPLPPNSPSPPGWEAWASASRFEAAPNAQSLSAAMISVSDHLEKERWKALSWKTSWPLAACLDAADSAETLRAWAARVAGGELGQLADWHRAEEAWSDSLDLTNLLADAASALPWTLQTLQSNPPFAMLPIWAYRHFRRPTAITSSQIQLADQQFRACRSDLLRSRLADLCLLLLTEQKSARGIDKLDIEAWLGASPGSVGLLGVRPKGLSLERWRRLIATNHDIEVVTEVYHYDIPALVNSLREAPSNPLILRLIAKTIELYGRHPSLASRLEVGQLDSAADVVSGLTDNNDTDHALTVLRFMLGLVDVNSEAAALRKIAGSTSTRDGGAWIQLLAALKIGRTPISRMEALLPQIYGYIGPQHPDSWTAMMYVRDALQKRTSDLDNDITWSRLGLPLPQPNAAEKPRIGSAFPTMPLHLASIELRDVGKARELKISLSSSSETDGQWIVLLGPNGAGKTTILRSLVLGLRNTNNPAIWPKGVFSNSWRRIKKEDESTSPESTISIVLVDGTQYKTVIRSNDSTNISQFPERLTPRLAPIFAYGCRRGSALGGAAREVNLGEDDGPEVATLFDEGADLVHAETWLVQLEGDTHKSTQSKGIYLAIVSALKNLLELQAIEVIDKRVWVTEHGGPRLLFSSLSDGYLTSAGWILDLIARWLSFAEKAALPVSSLFLQEMRGLVLIDEIDLHLHPKWQIEIISRTRRIFPQMSFCVTTHNPLTLVGAKPEEIWILSSDDGNNIIASPGIEIPMLLTGGQIYHRYFGIEDIYPDHLGRALQRFSFLSGYPGRNVEEHNELLAIQSLLRAAGIEPNWPIVAQHTGGQVG